MAEAEAIVGDDRRVIGAGACGTVADSDGVEDTPAVPDQEHLITRRHPTNIAIRGTLRGTPDLLSDVSCVVR